MRLRFRALSMIAASTLVAGALLAAPPAESRNADVLTLLVNFSYQGVINVTTPQGTPIGSTSGAPTLIPAGFYTLQFEQPGCTDVPLFTLDGPGVHVEENLAGGEEVSDQADANFKPNATYTWTSDAFPNQVHRFQTSSQVLGTPPPPAGAIIGNINPYIGKKATGGNHDIVGSEPGTFRGRLIASVTPAGKLSLTLKGKATSRLKTGRYTFAITDRSKHGGFVLKTPAHKSLTLTAVAFTGKKSVSVNLTKGTWHLATGTGKKPSPLVVTR